MRQGRRGKKEEEGEAEEDENESDNVEKERSAELKSFMHSADEPKTDKVTTHNKVSRPSIGPVTQEKASYQGQSISFPMSSTRAQTLVGNAVCCDKSKKYITS